MLQQHLASLLALCCVLLTACGGGSGETPSIDLPAHSTASYTALPPSKAASPASAASGQTASTVVLAEAATTGLSAQVTAAPGDGETVSGVISLEVRGSGMANVELLPASGYTPRLGVFAISENGTVARLAFDTKALSNGPLQVRISAFDKPAFTPGAREIVAMSPRTWNISNMPGQPGTSASIPITPNQSQELALADVAKITLKAGDLPDVPAGSIATIEKTSLEQVQSLWDDTAMMHRATGKAAFEATITLPDQPRIDIDVTLTVPQEIRESATAAEELRAFYVNRYIAEPGIGGSTNSVEPLPLRGARQASTLTVTLPKSAFQDNGTGKWVANVFVGKTDTAAQVTSSLPTHFKRLWWNLNLISPAFAQTTPTAKCDGKSIFSPVPEGTRISSKFGPRQLNNKNASTDHKGIDYAVGEGTEVKAAAKGKIEVAQNQRDKKTGAVIGYGYYIVLRHDDGSSTLYGHLQDGSAVFKVGEAVEAGQVIAKSGNTGTSEGPHLHFEYAPDGKTHVLATKVNPEPCIGKIVGGALTVADNGTLADDAFIVLFNNAEICRTEIGQPNNCAINDLRPGTYTITVVALVVPDNAGTYSITVNVDSLQIDGSKSASNVIPTGGRANHTLTVQP